MEVNIMICKKCGSSNIKVDYNVYVKSKSRSFLWNLLMVCCTCGFWILWMLIRKKKEKVVREKTCICQDCGNVWKTY
jgi:hypothetical protein